MIRSLFKRFQTIKDDLKIVHYISFNLSSFCSHSSTPQILPELKFINLTYQSRCSYSVKKDFSQNKINTNSIISEEKLNQKIEPKQFEQNKQQSDQTKKIEEGTKKLKEQKKQQTQQLNQNQQKDNIKIQIQIQKKTIKYFLYIFGSWVLIAFFILIDRIFFKLKREKIYSDWQLQKQLQKKQQQMLDVVKAHLTMSYDTNKEILRGPNKRIKFIEDSVYKQIQTIIDHSIVPQVIKAIYGRQESGKSDSLKHYTQSKRGKQPVIYVNLKLDGTDNQNIQKLLRLQKMDPIKCIFKLITNKNLKPKLEKLLQENGDPELMKNKDHKLTLIIDQIDRFKEQFRNPDLNVTINNYMTNVIYGMNDQNGVKIILVSSDRSFLENELCIIPGVKRDKFDFHQCKLSKEDLKMFLTGHKLSKSAVNLMLQSYDNKRDVNKCIIAYKDEMLKTNDEEKAFQKLNSQLSFDQSETLKTINSTIIKIGIKSAKQKQIESYKEIHEYLLQICKKKYSKGNQQKIAYINDRLEEKNILMENRFITFHKEKAYCQHYAKQQWVKSEMI